MSEVKKKLDRLFREKLKNHSGMAQYHIDNLAAHLTDQVVELINAEADRASIEAACAPEEQEEMFEEEDGEYRAPPKRVSPIFRRSE